MKITFERNGQQYSADLSAPISIGIPLRDGTENPNCFWAPMPEFSPVVADGFIGSTAQGGVVNFFNIRLNPHGNGTHTECVGHIARERYVLRDCLKEQHFFSKLVSVYPQMMENGDHVILKEQLESLLNTHEAEALIVRTMPNDPLKMRNTWSGSNPPYLHEAAAAYLADCGVQHLLLDLPSVDREEDGGKLLGHKAFWRYPQATRSHCTVTEMAYVPTEIRDGFYLLNLQTLNIDLDASPSAPVLYGFEAD
jgi:kynurenine formamidase